MQLTYHIFIKKIYCIIFPLLILCNLSCSKLVQVVPPVTSVTGASVYGSDATAAAVLTGLYTTITPVNTGYPTLPMISIYAGLSADELTLWSGVSNGTDYYYYKNILSSSTAGYEIWNSSYPNIFICNSAIESLNNANTLTPAVKQQLLGEAKFMRAMFYFYLVNLYGDVPLVLSTDY